MAAPGARRLCACIACVVLSTAFVYARAAAADEAVTIDRGYLDMNFGAGPIVIGGTGGFTFQGGVDLTGGIFNPKLCNLDPLHCVPGATVDLHAYWSSSDLPGRATYQGVVYSLSTDLASMNVEFTGTATLPPAAGGDAVVTAPFAFTGRFDATTSSTSEHVRLDLSGAGVASLYLTADPAYVGSWRITRVVYEFGPALPEPWKSADIGAVQRKGITILGDGTLVVSGDGADIFWGADSFRFTYRPLEGDGDVVARVVTQTSLEPYAKAGVMLRESLDPSSAHVIIDVRPDGAIEFMTRAENGGETSFVAGAVAPGPPAWVKLSRAGGTITGSLSADGVAWTEVGSVTTTMPAGVLAGLAVTSHDENTLNLAVFDHLAVTTAPPPPQNLVVDGGFEAQMPPALGPGWVSDDPFRQVPAKSETHQPRTGLQNGACWTPDSGDCGMYQDVVAPATGTYTLTIPASADRAGGLVGANLNGTLTATANVEVRDFGVYESSVMTFAASAGDTIRIWMYSPWSRGYVVIDDVMLTVAP